MLGLGGGPPVELDYASAADAVELLPTLALLIRALSPFPGARTTRGGEILKILSARDGKKTAAQGGMPGEISELTSNGFRVTSGEGSLVVQRVHPAGRNVMSGADYLKGYRLEKGERLGV